MKFEIGLLMKINILLDAGFNKLLQTVIPIT